MLFDRVIFFLKGIAVHVKNKGEGTHFVFCFKPVKESGTCKTQIYPNAVLHFCEIVTCSSVRFGGTILRCSGINKVSELMKTLT